jgi:hypothetical protein
VEIQRCHWRAPSLSVSPSHDAAQLNPPTLG